MVKNLINEIEQAMLSSLNNEQLAQLRKVLDYTFRNIVVTEKDAVNTESNNQILVENFISAKKVEGCSPNSIAYYRSTINNALIKLGKEVIHITTDDLRHYLNTYQSESGASKVTVDNIRRILSSFFSWLEEENYIVKSPVRRIHKVKVGKTVKETYTDESLELMRDHCSNPRDLALIDLLASTGMRVGELVKLNRSDIDYHNRECIVTGKGDKQRKVYFDARTKIHLQKYINSRTDSNEALFVSLLAPYERLQISGVEIRLRQMGKDLNIPKVHPHKFRRTLATMAIDKGMPIEQVQHLLGHQSLDTTLQYAMVNQNNVKLSHHKSLVSMSQFIEIFYGMETTPVKDYIDDSFPGEWGTEDKDGNGVKVIRTTNFTNSGKLNLADVVTRSIEDRKVVRKQIKKYDTILERSGGTADNPVGRVVLFEEDNLFLCNNFTQVLRFKDVDPRFAFYALYYFYQTNRTAIRSMGSKTTGIQNLNMSKYLEIGIPNASDEDQKAFVTIAEQADKSEFVGCKSQFIEMFGDTHMRSDHSRQWKEVVEIINGKDYKSIQVEDGGYPVYGTGGEMARASDYLSPANSILLGRKGTIDKPLLIREKYWNVDTAFGAVPDEKVLHYVYFYWHCKTIDFNVLNKGTTLPSTTKVDLLNLWIKIPSMEEQTRFGSIVEQADKSEYYN